MDDCEDFLRNLLAVIHRDGGHHTHDHGIEKSTEDAMGLVPNLRMDNAQLRKQILAYQKDLGLCRKILYYIQTNSDDAPKCKRAAGRCLKELKQK